MEPKAFVAAAEQPSLLGITAKTSAEKAKYGVWKKKPVGIHDVRDTYATEAEDIFGCSIPSEQ